MHVLVFVCGHVIMCPVHMYVHARTYRSVQECGYSMCIYACVCVFVCVCTHILLYYMYVAVYMWKCGVYTYVRTYVTYMVWFAWQLVVQVATHNDALQW